MVIDVSAKGFELTEALRHHAQRRMRFALGAAQVHARNARVRLSDENGPRGGTDKRCRVQVAIPGFRNLVVEDTQADLYVAIDRAADRIGRVVSRRIAQRREHAAISHKRRPLPELAPSSEDAIQHSLEHY